MDITRLPSEIRDAITSVGRHGGGAELARYLISPPLRSSSSLRFLPTQHHPLRPSSRRLRMRPSATSTTVGACVWCGVQIQRRSSVRFVGFKALRRFRRPWFACILHENIFIFSRKPRADKSNKLDAKELKQAMTELQKEFPTLPQPSDADVQVTAAHACMCMHASSLLPPSHLFALSPLLRGLASRAAPG